LSYAGNCFDIKHFSGEVGKSVCVWCPYRCPSARKSGLWMGMEESKICISDARWL